VSRIVYLHGFASGPTSKKAQFFRERFAQLGIGLDIPDLADGDFERLTITGQLGVIERASRGEPVTLIGSSMGGYLAARSDVEHYASERRREIAETGAKTVRQLGGALDRTFAALDPYLVQLRLEQRAS